MREKCITWRFEIAVFSVMGPCDLTSNPIPKIIQNWNVDGNVTLRKLNYTRAPYIFYIYHILFPPTVNTVTYYLSKNLMKQTVFNINTHFTIRITYVAFLTSTTIIPQGNLTADCEIKQHIWQWKAREDCSSSVVPCVVLIIWVTFRVQWVPWRCLQSSTNFVQFLLSKFSV